VAERFCPSCGTEVGESALFCPSCGHPIEVGASPAPGAGPGPGARPPSRAEAQPPPREPPPAESTAPPEPPPGPPGARPGTTVTVTKPEMLSGWLVGGGAALAALGCFVGLFDRAFNPLDALLLPAFLLLAASVFLFAERAGGLSWLELATLAVAFVGFGVALDRIGFGVAGVAELLVFLGAGAACVGAALVQLGVDQPASRVGVR
jgi:hypothetical protein